MLYDALSQMVEGISQIDPMIQLAFWAFVTSVTLLYTFERVFAGKCEPDYDEWRLIIAVTLSLFWLINATTWAISAVWLMVFTDTIFLIASIVIYKRIRQLWSFCLIWLYVLAIGLDVWLWRGLTQPIYALLSNAVFAMQLLTVSVFFVDRNKKDF